MGQAMFPGCWGPQGGACILYLAGTCGAHHKNPKPAHTCAAGALWVRRMGEEGAEKSGEMAAVRGSMYETGS